MRLITIVCLRPCPRLSEYFYKRRRFLRFQKTLVFTDSVFESLSSVHINGGNTIASLTGHALYDVWYHRTRIPPFSSVHENNKLAFSKKLHSGDRFAGKRPLRVDGSLK